MKLAEIEKLAVEVADLASREAQLATDQARISDELNTVRAAKSQKLQQLAGNGNGTAGTGGTPVTAHKGVTSDAKERVYRMLAAEPLRVFATNDVRKSLQIPRSTASVYLSELAKAGRITRLGVGRYRALSTADASTATPPPPHDAAWPDKIVSYLSSIPHQTLSALAIAKHFGVSDASSINTIRGALSRLHRSGKIQKTGHGGYKAAPAATHSSPLDSRNFGKGEA